MNMHFPFGNNIKLYIEGGSHDEKIEMILKGFPKGVRIDTDALENMLIRRSARNSDISTARKEEDRVIFISGIENGITDGTTIKAYIQNTDVRSGDYSEINSVPRPSHADLAAIKKYGSDVDLRGGGHFSGRLTALLCVAGSLAEDFLRSRNISISAHISSVGNIYDTPFDKVSPQEVNTDFPVINRRQGEKMIALIISAAAQGDSVGGTIECAVKNLPAGLGEHMFRSAEERISSAVFAVPAVKGISFGSGFKGSSSKGSENNDAFYYDGDEIRTRTNNAGGILGGMTDGMPVIFSAALKPTPSISKEQDSVDLRKHKNVKLKIKGRHDPCIVPRAVPVIESAAALAVLDLMLECEDKKDIVSLRNNIEKTDLQIIDLLKKRFSYAKDIAFYKKEHFLPIENKERENYLINKLKTAAGEELSDCTEEIYKTIIESSKQHQEKVLGTDIRAGLIGKSLKHSFSPLIHSYLASYSYDLYEISEDSLEDFMKDCPIDCFNVTIPYKKAVIPYLKGISEKAERIGAVNTVIHKSDGFYGYNTDYSGFMYLLKKSGIVPADKKVLILGSGGACAMVKTVMEDMKAKEIVVISRSGKNNYQNISLHKDADIIVNTTPVGMYPDTGTSPVDIDMFPALSGVIDLIYNPSVTKLLYDAAKRNIPHINGLPMLIKQAEDSSSIFLSEDRPSITDKITEIIEKKTRNILLIGMPSCGKTTVGHALAQKTGRKFTDTDKLIEEKTGMPASEVIKNFGEDYFRKLETEALIKAGRMSGTVIATGGGIVTREENGYYLRENSFIIYLDKDIKHLSSEGRPVSESRGIENLYRERRPLYEKYADIKISADRPVEETVKEIEEAIK